jgi:hypothetical protein
MFPFKLSFVEFLKLYAFKAYFFVTFLAEYNLDSMFSVLLSSHTNHLVTQ